MWVTDNRDRRRHQSQTERDVSGMAARRARTEGVPAIVDDDVTGRYHGEELDRRRAARPTEARLSRLEQKQDLLAADVSDLRQGVGEANGQLRVLVAHHERQATLEAERIKATIEISTRRDQTDIEVDKAERLDIVAARSSRRALVATVIGALCSGSVLTILAAWAVTKC